MVNGRIMAAAQEERFSRIKHDHNFPKLAVEYCLSEGGVTASELDFVVFYEKPFLKFDRLLETYMAFVPQGLKSFLSAMPLWSVVGCPGFWEVPRISDAPPDGVPRPNASSRSSLMWS